MHAWTSTDSQLLTCAPAAFAAATAARTASLGPRSRTCAASGGTIALQPTEPAASSLTGGSVCMLLISMRTPLTLSWQMGKVRPKTRGLGSSCFTCEKSKKSKSKQATCRSLVLMVWVTIYAHMHCYAMLCMYTSQPGSTVGGCME